MKSSTTPDFAEIKAQMMLATPEDAFGIGRCGPVGPALLVLTFGDERRLVPDPCGLYETSCHSKIYST
jgi:hypothetical protein